MSNRNDRPYKRTFNLPNGRSAFGETSVVGNGNGLILTNSFNTGSLGYYVDGGRRTGMSLTMVAPVGSSATSVFPTSHGMTVLGVVTDKNQSGIRADQSNWLKAIIKY